jgi:hypothetical protein
MENVITKYPTLPSNSSVSLALGVYNTTPDSSGPSRKNVRQGQFGSVLNIRSLNMLWCS